VCELECALMGMISYASFSQWEVVKAARERDGDKGEGARRGLESSGLTEACT
jgi:hypothetical protein